MASKNLPIVDWKQIDASAPGKFIISGEYSVVYEKQAVAAAIDLTTRVVIRPNRNNNVRLNLKNLDSIREWPTGSLTSCRLVGRYSQCLEYNDSMPAKLDHLLHSRYHVPQNRNNPESTPTEDGQDDEKQATSSSTATSSPSVDSSKIGKVVVDKRSDDAAIAFLLLYIGLSDSYSRSERLAIDVEVESDVPVGSGLGSSSAYSVALCGALMRVFKVAAEKYIISDWAFNIDKFFHGRPSGVDNNVVTHGGCILFQNGKIKGHEVHHNHSIRVLLIDTCVSRSTRALSEKVAAELLEKTVLVNSIFNSINEITTHIWRRVSSPDFEPSDIAEYVHTNQVLLDELGVGHEKLTHIYGLARGYNLAAKQTGAGGGGTAFVLYDGSEHSRIIGQLRKELEDASYVVRDHSINYEGLSVRVTQDR